MCGRMRECVSEYNCRYERAKVLEYCAYCRSESEIVELESLCENAYEWVQPCRSNSRVVQCM